MVDIDDLMPCPDCGGQGINTDTLGTKTAVCRKCKGSGRTRAAIAAMPGGGPGAWVPADHLAEANREIARLRAGREWRPIDSAPRDGTEILIYANGMAIQAWFCKEGWSMAVSPAEYGGAIWCAFDDAIQFEVEETPFGFHDGAVTHWQPLPEGPAS